MSNVKPGDLARIIADPDRTRALGMQVYVKCHPKFDSTWCMYLHNVQPDAWVVEALEYRKLRHSRNSVVSGVETVLPGQTFAVSDACLKRIDPPADTADLLSEQPLPHELQPLQEPKCHTQDA